MFLFIHVYTNSAPYRSHDGSVSTVGWDLVLTGDLATDHPTLTTAMPATAWLLVAPRRIDFERIAGRREIPWHSGLGVGHGVDILTS